MKIRSDNARIKSGECDFEIATSLKEEKLAGQNIYELTLIIDGVLPKEYEKKLEQLCERAAEGLINNSRASLMQLAREIELSASHNVKSDGIRN